MRPPVLASKLSLIARVRGAAPALDVRQVAQRDEHRRHASEKGGPVLEKRERIAHDGAYVGLKVSRAASRIRSGRAPDLHGQDVEGAQQGARVMNRQDGGHAPASLLVRTDDLRTAWNRDCKRRHSPLLYG